MNRLTQITYISTPTQYTQIHTHADTFIHPEMCSHIHLYRNMLTYMKTLTNSLTHIQTRSQTHPCSHIPLHINKLTYTHTVTHSLIRDHTNTFTHNSLPHNTLKHTNMLMPSLTHRHAHIHSCAH